jgi:hypothetical protein
MRKITAALLMIAFIGLVSCKKASTNVDVAAALIGNWELTQIAGAMLAPVNYAPGNGNMYKFTSENHYELYQQGQLTKEGTYQIVADATVKESVCLTLAADQYTNRIVFNNDYSATKVFLQIESNTLTFISGCYAVDAGHSSTYRRL